MGKDKRTHRKRSIKSVFAAYMVAGLLSALGLSIMFSAACQYGQSALYKKYKEQYPYPGQHRVIEIYHEEGGGTIQEYFVGSAIDLFTPSERAAYNVLGILSVAVVPVFFVLSISVTSLLFYRWELQKPLEILGGAADKIADNDLDFEIRYRKQDELGRLCESFEKMRAALQDSYYGLWRQIEERRRLNAAFSHDLRTPLTVLKGQGEMLAKYAPQMTADKVARTAETMGRHIARLEKYVNMMSDLQRLEDVETDRQPVSLEEVAGQLLAVGRLVCKDREFVFADGTARGKSLNLDMAVVMRVYENLLANAARFAREKVSVSVAAEGGCLRITVADDGCGFTAKDLSEATKPFYRSAGEEGGGHFGMGLNICKVLCEKHGGGLRLENKNGASVTAAFRQ